MSITHIRGDLRAIEEKAASFGYLVLRTIIYADSLTAEWVAGLLVLVLGLIILDPFGSVIASNVLYSSLLLIPLDHRTIEVIWGGIFMVVGFVSVLGILTKNHALRIIGTGLSFTLWMFMFALTVIGNSQGLGWAYNLAFAVGQLLTFIQLSARDIRSVIYE